MTTPTNVNCAVDFVPVNEYRTRIIAGFVFILSATFLYTHFWIIPALLCIDFFQRAFFSDGFSLLAMLAAGVERILRVGYKATDQAPKRFAAQIGFLFSDMIVICYALDLTVTANALAAILALFAFLESVFAFCAGCHVYTLMRKFKLIN